MGGVGGSVGLVRVKLRVGSIKKVVDGDPVSSEDCIEGCEESSSLLPLPFSDVGIRSDIAAAGEGVGSLSSSPTGFTVGVVVGTLSGHGVRQHSVSLEGSQY